MSILLYIAIVVFVLYFEYELVTTALAPIIDITVSVLFIFRLIVVIVVELALMVIAPVALLLGYESRRWHIDVARKLMLGGKRNVDAG